MQKDAQKSVSKHSNRRSGIWDTMTIWNLVLPSIKLGFLEQDIVVPSVTTILDPNPVTNYSISEIR